jgi:hypothetical protein
MATAIKINRLTPEQAAYLAGLIDGEGTITLTRMHRHENRRLVMSISSGEQLRDDRRAMPYAATAGYLTDEDVFRDVS